ncbi:fosfomycin resistance glutathione transferase [Paralysiella testudinis]|uniref:Fosfomycin resistance glutathione transferase n=1 Tax=Paralysiella testudinis TaxID=2809020 RepID=A0A892ZIE6_9NEIS|nr:fosfomycin resistance glutathione transferase [Paralysiella testudinis]QRQ82218.1 fosfomycin resistance glutathione transferase [Paralysiella testudinis]
MLSGLSHVTLAVLNVARSVDFYTQVLGLRVRVQWQGGAYLSCGALWLCLSEDEPCPKTDYTHLAFAIEAEHFDDFVRQIREQEVVEWRQNRSEGASLYLLDPDGHKLEIHVGSLDTRLNHLRSQPYPGLVWFD